MDTGEVAFTAIGAFSLLFGPVFVSYAARSHGDPNAPQNVLTLFLPKYWDELKRPKLLIAGAVLAGAFLAVVIPAFRGS